MSESQTDGKDCIDIEQRTERALTECMTVLPNHGRADGAPGLFVVIGENDDTEQTYLADTQTTSCECKDDQYNLADQESCKHVRRCEIATSETAVPASALGRIEIDDTFGAHVDASAKFATADGGIINGTTGEEIDDTTEENVWSSPRPELDKHGNPTGCQIVECTSCGCETITSLVEFASHRDGCKHEGREAGR
jgi:hypothetical protein